MARRAVSLPPVRPANRLSPAPQSYFSALAVPLSRKGAACAGAPPPPYGSEEQGYLDLVAHVMRHGERRHDRTGEGTLAVFGAQCRYSLVGGRLPLFTTKKVFWKGVLEETLWFLRGCTDSKALSAKGVRIWDANGSREFLARRGLSHRREGDLGPVYGFQWRHWGAEYVDCQTPPDPQGLDQLEALRDGLRRDPHGRRHILTAWNPSDLPGMALPPCHCLCQFYVSSDGKGLSCHMYQRSADLGLGVPFNVAGYALLTHIVAAAVGGRDSDGCVWPALEAREFIHTMGDAHVYLSHRQALSQQLQRTPLPAARVRLARQVDRWEDLQACDVVLEGYQHHGAALPRMKMAV